ncbi:membrane protein insertase YidC [Candidatus Acetothermia bacterium]|nr:membrane protein insertase YidC [Candidatus Acetothermia bacterium]MCI2427213.1 membrane protein insertase YidC [Candidatus Acetothermia bacterium]MCI2428995.1 membrane protein insertase YidC [Candidatus Acetothermia bacterium]
MKLAKIIVGIVIFTIGITLLTRGERNLTYELREQEIEVRTALSRYIFSEQGGTLRSLFLHFAPAWGRGAGRVELVAGTKTDPDTLARRYVANAIFPFTFKDNGILDDTVYQIIDPRFVDENELRVELQGKFGDLIVIRRFTIRNDPYYTLEIELIFRNETGYPVDMPDEMIMAKHIPPEVMPPLKFIFDKTVYSVLLAPGSYHTFDGIGWMDAFTAFFLTTRENLMIAPFHRFTPLGERLFGIVFQEEKIPAYSTRSFHFSLYAGRRRFILMEAQGLGRLDSPGLWTRLIVPVIHSLTWLYRFTGNYGWAIILFTVVTRVILFPVIQKQLESMAKMQQIAPKLKKIQERYKDDRQLLQQKMIELYRREGINPLGGCLPMLLPMPILILLFNAILSAAEQIHLSPGFLWIPSLSLRDPFFLLPVFATVAMILQQRFTPMTGMTPQGNQRLMGYLFPVAMGVMMINAPAGIWLHWLLATLMQVGQQYMISRRQQVAVVGGSQIGTPIAEQSLQTTGNPHLVTAAERRKAEQKDDSNNSTDLQHRREG